MSRWISDICPMTKVSSDSLCVRVQDLGPRGQVDPADMCPHFVFSSDPYGYNEKKRRRDNLMRMSGLSGRRETVHADNITPPWSVSSEAPGLSLGGPFSCLAMNRPKAVLQSTRSPIRKGKCFTWQ